MSRFDDFDSMIALFMQEFGFSTTYIHAVSSTPNDLTGKVDVITEEFEVEAIKSELIRPNEGTRAKPGSLIESAELVLFVRPTEKLYKYADAIRVNPASDRVKINDVTWRVVTIKEYNPSASDCILYEMYIKR